MIFGLVLLALCAAGIIASIWMTSKPKPSKQPDQNIPKKSDYRASGDFSALIDAIRDEGETYRREEGKENIGKRVRDWITITILGLTLIALAKTYYAVSDQVAEMKKTYEPIANQAKEMIANRRPFIGIAPEEIKIISPLTFNATGPSISFDVWIRNTGRSAAINAISIVNGFHVEPFMPSGLPINTQDLISLYSRVIDCNKSKEPEYPGWGTIILPGGRAKQTIDSNSIPFRPIIQPDPRTGMVSVFFPICIV